MTISILLSMISFSFVMSISPGPVNFVILNSSINYGFKKTFLFISGATIGFTLLLVVIAFGFQTTLNKFPVILSIIEVLGSLFIIYIAIKIIKSNTNIELDKNKNSIPTFFDGFLLQWLNPKAWLATIAGVSLFSSEYFFLISFISIYFIVCYLSLSFWGFIGQKATIFFKNEKKLKILNTVMGSILIILVLSLLINK